MKFWLKLNPIKIQLRETDKQHEIVFFHFVYRIENLKIIIPSFFFRSWFSDMAPKKDPKEASASTKKKDTPAAAATTPTATATASAKKSTKPAGSTTTTAKVVTKERKEKVQTKALKAKQRVVR